MGLHIFNIDTIIFKIFDLQLVEYENVESTNTDGQLCDTNLSRKENFIKYLRPSRLCRVVNRALGLGSDRTGSSVILNILC